MKFILSTLLLTISWQSFANDKIDLKNKFNCSNGYTGEGLKLFETLQPKNPTDPAGLVATAVEYPMTPLRVIEAYKNGTFPWNPTTNPDDLSWFNPPTHAIIDFEPIVAREGRKGRKLRAAYSKIEKNGWTITVNQNFSRVIKACAEHKRQNYNHVWLTEEVQNTFIELHKMGWAHSVEVWNKEGELIGGLYGLMIDGVFSSESMFNKVSDSGKAAVIYVSELLYAKGYQFLDTQVENDNTRSNYLAYSLSRSDYIKRRNATRETYLRNHPNGDGRETLD